MATPRVFPSIAFALVFSCRGVEPRPIAPAVTSPAESASSVGSATPSAVGSASTSGGPAVDCARAFDPPVGAAPLCDEHVMGNGAEIHWRSFATTQPLAEIEAHYRAVASACGLARTPATAHASYANGNRHLDVHAADDASAPRCERRPAPTDRAVVIVSEMTTFR